MLINKGIRGIIGSEPKGTPGPEWVIKGPLNLIYPVKIVYYRGVPASSKLNICVILTCLFGSAT